MTCHTFQLAHLELSHAYTQLIDLCRAQLPVHLHVAELVRQLLQLEGQPVLVLVQGLHHRHLLRLSMRTVPLGLPLSLQSTNLLF